jgi:hypothetical protein
MRMQHDVQSSVTALRESIRSRKANAESAFKTFKLQEIIKELPTVELAQAEGWQTPGRTPPVQVKPRIR